jgi:hypothetical protein
MSKYHNASRTSGKSVDVVLNLAHPRLARLADGQAAIAGATVGNDLTRADLVEALYRTVGVARAESARPIELMFKEITDCLERGETV